MDIATLDRSIEDIDLMCRIVRAAPPERFDMSNWRASTACGTAACIAGWCVMDGRLAGAYPPSAEDTMGHEPMFAERAIAVARRAIPALPDSSIIGWNVASFEAPSPRAYIFAGREDFRRSFVDDAPFTATPAEIACLGAEYARGLAEREAALNRLGIVRACLVQWRAALAPKPVPCVAEVARA